MSTQIIWNSLAQKICIFSPVYLVSHGLLFYTLGYNPLLYLLLKCFSSGHWELFQWLLQLAGEQLWHRSPYQISVCCWCGLSTSSAFWHYRSSRIIWYVSCPSPGKPFLQDPWFLSMENGIRSQDLGGSWAYWYSGTCFCLDLVLLFSQFPLASPFSSVHNLSFSHGIEVSLTISSEFWKHFQVCLAYYWFLFFVALTLLSTSKADFNSTSSHYLVSSLSAVLPSLSYPTGYLLLLWAFQKFILVFCWLCLSRFGIWFMPTQQICQAN